MDLNNDGVNDILSGSYSRRDRDMAGLFQVLWGKEGGFKTAEVLKGADDEPLIIPIAGREQMTENICTRPTAVDWDGDGDLDLIVGNFAGTFYRFEGQGDGKFAPKPEKITAGDDPLRIEGVHSDPFVIDWDGDGDLDIVSGSSNGGVQWAENVAGAKQPPKLKAFQSLIEPAMKVAYGEPLAEHELIGPASATRVWVDDYNADGKLDILVGDNVTLTGRADGLNQKEFKQQKAKWEKDFKAAAKELGLAKDAEARAKATKRYRELFEQRSKFITEQRTGFVWVYVQK